MAIVKYNDDFFGPFFTKLPSLFDEVDEYLPSTLKRGNEMVEISEDEKSVYVKAALPGVKPEDVDINVKGNMLTIKGESKQDEDTKKGKKVVFSRRMQSSFSYTTSLPAEVNSKTAKAVVKNGILSLELEKVEDKGTKVKVVEE